MTDEQLEQLAESLINVVTYPTARLAEMTLNLAIMAIKTLSESERSRVLTFIVVAINKELEKCREMNDD